MKLITLYAKFKNNDKTLVCIYSDYVMQNPQLCWCLLTRESIRTLDMCYLCKGFTTSSSLRSESLEMNHAQYNPCAGSSMHGSFRRTRIHRLVGIITRIRLLPSPSLSKHLHACSFLLEHDMVPEMGADAKCDSYQHCFYSHINRTMHCEETSGDSYRY